LASAKLELQVDNPQEYIDILKDSGHEDSRIEFRHASGKLELRVSAESSKELLSSVDSILKKLIIVAGTKDTIERLDRHRSGKV
jgi:tRNA threonylcarbamoyladenosine modification (KEOPS) complex  Pcc1 subunit